MNAEGIVLATDGDDDNFRGVWACNPVQLNGQIVELDRHLLDSVSDASSGRI